MFAMYLGDRISAELSVVFNRGFSGWNKCVFEGALCSDGVLIFHCCITNYHKFRDRNDTHLLAHSSVG